VRRAPFRDGRRMAATAYLFSHGLGVSTVALPLLAVAAGHGDAAVGVLVACSAGAQISMRVVLAGLLHRFTERAMLLTAAVLLIGSTAVVLIWDSVAVFVLALVLQGLARGLFWIGLQAQVVRTADDSLRPLARVDFVAGIGLVTGPAAIAVVGGSLPVALGLGVLLTALSLWPMLGLRALPLFERRYGDARINVWRRPGLTPALLAGICTGTWRGLLSSYIPVILIVADYSPATVGLLVGVATSASILGSLTAGLAGNRLARAALVTAAALTAAGLVGVGLMAQALPVVFVALVLSGLGAGTLQTLASALAARAVEPRLRGSVVAQVGTYRAGALFGAPLAVAGLLLVVPLAPAMAIAGALTALPALVRWPAGDAAAPQKTPFPPTADPRADPPAPTGPPQIAPERGTP
jgi:MFS family permease